MKSKGLIILFASMFVLVIHCTGQAPPNCRSNIAILCASGGPKVSARAGQGACETYDNQCLLEQLNCIRYKRGEPLLTPC